MSSHAVLLYHFLSFSCTNTEKNVKRAKCFSSEPISMYCNTECIYDSCQTFVRLFKFEKFKGPKKTVAFKFDCI